MIYAWAHVFLFGCFTTFGWDNGFGNFAVPLGQSGSKFYDEGVGRGGVAKCRMPNKRGPEINSRQANKQKRKKKMKLKSKINTKYACYIRQEGGSRIRIKTQTGESLLCQFPCFILENLFKFWFKDIIKIFLRYINFCACCCCSIRCVPLEPPLPLAACPIAVNFSFCKMDHKICITTCWRGCILFLFSFSFLFLLLLS